MYKPIMSNVIAYYDDNPKPSSLFESIFWFISVVSAAIIERLKELKREMKSGKRINVMFVIL